LVHKGFRVLYREHKVRKAQQVQVDNLASKAHKDLEVIQLLLAHVAHKAVEVFKDPLDHRAHRVLLVFLLQVHKVRRVQEAHWVLLVQPPVVLKVHKDHKDHKVEADHKDHRAQEAPLALKDSQVQQDHVVRKDRLV
jgi:hypothetical protein